MVDRAAGKGKIAGQARELTLRGGEVRSAENAVDADRASGRERARDRVGRRTHHFHVGGAAAFTDRVDERAHRRG